MHSSVEREVKLAVGPAFRLPDLAGVVDGIVPVGRGETSFETVYYDTDDLRLARSGISLRCRTGESEAGLSRWTVKLPDGDAGPAISRREVVLDAPARVIPDEVTNLVRAHVRGSLLAPVAVMETVRRKTSLRSAETGLDVAEIDEDEVSVVDGGSVALRFREVEVELVDGADPAMLPGVVDRLRDAGAEDAKAASKLAQALGTGTLGLPEVVVRALPDEPTIGDMAASAIASGVLRILRHDPGVRLGGDPEDVHQMRVGTRRLRSDLKTFAAVLEPAIVAPVRDELRWIAGVLGVARDADVLYSRLAAHAAALDPSDGRAAGALLRSLDGERTKAYADARTAMDGDRYVALLDKLVHAAQHPPLAGESAAPADRALRHVVRRQWRKLAKLVASLGPDPDDESLHAVRIATTRARYAAEASVGVLGKPAKRLGKALAELQEVLGDVHDSVVAETWLRGAAQTTRSGGFAAGLLAARQRDEREAARDQWPSAWSGARAEWKAFRS